MSHKAPEPGSGMPFARAGRSGLVLPRLSLGLWQNFGESTAYAAQRELVLHAYERGIVHLDLANNYGPPPGSAEAAFGRLLATDLRGHRDELLISTKAGYRMGPGPYGEGGSRKYLLSSLDASLRRLGTDHVDVFYSHRFDPTTPLPETIGALATAVSSGRATYAAISSYSAERTTEALAVADDLGLPLDLHQPSYSMLNRWIEAPGPGGRSLLDVVGDSGTGLIVFSPLAQGMLSDRYLDGVPPDSRAARSVSLRPEHLAPENLARIRALREVASGRGEPLARTAVAWTLRDPRVTSVLVGARTTAQVDESLAALDAAPFTTDELAAIDAVTTETAPDGSRRPLDTGINIWAARSSDL
ncbi:aldo/keto reductase [Oerskovia sp. KBS0722]|uniref:aldo/keto reductase n=1 Tax=Oerskovia sp. KBS0722 TaxID=1179673 RepID=UPI00110EB65A|nr:aldo/keto reductase [Oerskovia sp. KBS0722]QDW63076.1 aldo/keto reductase [Oerskovia sp. KBS0722]